MTDTISRRLLRRLPMALLWVAGLAQAHDTWVLPQRFDPVPGEPLVVRLSSGEGLAPKVVPRQTTVDSLRLVQAGGRREPVQLDRGKTSVQARFEAPAPGLACLAASSDESEIRIEPRLVNLYLKEIHPPAGIMEAWKRQQARGEPWIERYAKDAKACLRIGPGDDGWPALANLGQRLELVPQRDPTRLVVGDELVLVLTLDGQPAPDVALRLIAEGRPERVQRTDAQGRARFRLAAPGTHLVAATVLRQPGADGAPWTSRFATLGFGVGRRGAP